MKSKTTTQGVLCLSAAVVALMFSATTEARLASNRLASNRLASNRLASNRLASNRLASNRLASNRLASNRLASNDVESDRPNLDRTLRGDGAFDDIVAIELPDRTRLVR